MGQCKNTYSRKAEIPLQLSQKQQLGQSSLSTPSYTCSCFDEKNYGTVERTVEPENHSVKRQQAGDELTPLRAFFQCYARQ